MLRRTFVAFRNSAVNTGRAATSSSIAVPVSRSVNGDYSIRITGTTRYEGNRKDSGSGSSSSDNSPWWQYGAPLVIALGFLLDATNTAESCGIVGVVGGEDASGFLLEGLTILRNRGYDSAGIASVPNDGTLLSVSKYASRDSTADSIDLLRANVGKHAGHHTGIAHTRWATHGGKTDENAHPHTDAKDRIAVVHNGTINNSYDLKKELQSKGVIFRSETDTEVIAQLIGIYLDKGYTTKEAVTAALKRFV